MRMAVHKEDNLAAAEQIIDHVGDTFLEVHLVLDIFFVFWVALGLKVAENFGKSDQC